MKNQLECLEKEIVNILSQFHEDSELICRIISETLKAHMTDAFVEEISVKLLNAILFHSPSLFPVLIDNDDYNFSVRITSWGPGQSSVLHKHNNWTVSGVLSGNLEFKRFEEIDSKIFISRKYQGSSGDIGWVLPGCIHQVTNNEQCDALSVHIFSGEKRKVIDNNRVNVVRGVTNWYGKKEVATRKPGDYCKAILNSLKERDFEAKEALLTKFSFIGDEESKKMASTILAHNYPSCASESIGNLFKNSNS